MKKSEVAFQNNAIYDTKKYIINTARHLFSDFSYLGVSMSDIAKKLNITKAALYYHFKGKEEIYIKVLDEVFSDLSQIAKEALQETTIDKKLLKLIKNYLVFGCKEKNLIKAIMMKMAPSDSQIKSHIIQLREQLFDLVQPIIDELIMHKKNKNKIDSKVLTSLITGMMDGLLLEYSFMNKKLDSENVANQIVGFLF